MNFGAHIVVARHLGDDPRFWLGAALPDLAAMGGFRLLGDTTDDQITAGIGIHHRTDEAFHRHPWFTDLQRTLQSVLLDDGLSRGAARAVAHVGPELLLDASLLAASGPGSGPGHGDTIGAALAELPTLGDDLAPLVRPAHRDDWAHHLDRVASWHPANDDHDVDAIARRLHRILSRRPRLTFGSEQIGVVATHLRSINDHVERTATVIVGELVGELRSR
ncbi:MAG: hypothetical protein R2710_29605 [Acidimicrobiales bacterium]